MAASPPLTLVFDLDGTLVDTAPDLVAALNVALAAERCAAVTIADARAMIGAGARALLKRGLDARGVAVSPDTKHAIHIQNLDHYKAHIADESRPFPNVVAAIDGMRAAGHRLAVCTNKPEAYARLLLEALGLADRFGAIVGGDTLPVNKPDRAPLDRAIADCGGDLARAVMIGDSRTDLLTARAAGIPTVLVDFGYTDVPARDLGAEVVVSDFAEIPAAVARARG